MRDPKVSNVPNESKLQRALMPNSRMFLLFLIVFAVITFFFSDRLWLSICEGVIILLLIIYSVIMRARKRRTLERYIESVTYDTESARNNTLQNFPLPMAVFRPADSQVIWANQNFFDLCGRHKPTVDMRITDVIPEFSGRWLLEGNTQCPELLEYQGHKYQIHGNLVRTNPDDAASYMGITYWVDVTDYEKIRLEYYASRPIIAVIVIDNYDELIRGLTDRKRNELRDAIEDKLLQWCEGKGGFFRRYDRDRYLYVFEERHLDELRENKFASLLDSVHAVTSPSGIRATVSVGIGRDGDSLDECYNFAILGTEMALSRGGDQATRVGLQSRVFAGLADRRVHACFRIGIPVAVEPFRQVAVEEVGRHMVFVEDRAYRHALIGAGERHKEAFLFGGEHRGELRVFAACGSDDVVGQSSMQHDVGELLPAKQGVAR